MPLFRSSMNGASPIGFKGPKGSEPTPVRTPGAARGSASTTTPHSAARCCPIGEMTPLRHKFASVAGSSPTPAAAGATHHAKEVIYPTAKGRTGEEIMLQRLSRRTDVHYHIPGGKKVALETMDEDGRVIKSFAAKEMEKEKKRIEEEEAAAATAARELKATTAAAAGGEDGVSAVEETEIGDGGGEVEEDEEGIEIISRLPPSTKQKLYFHVRSSGSGAGTKHESSGIIIVDLEECGVQMYDRLGRQHGNRPEPGYPLKQEEIDKLKAGVELKVGMKTVKLVTALHEDAFRSGEFFLRSEHYQRKKEEKRKEKEACEAAKQQHIPKMSFGTKFGAFSSLGFRKRPKEGETGFTVPVQGRPKMSKGGVIFEDLVPLHDPDRTEAVTLFRADYKRDVNGRRIVSVVVDPVIGDKLRPHQRIGVKFLYDCITADRMPGYYGAILADEMGLGKTIQTVAIIYTCLKQGKFGVPISRKCLVVAPSSLVKNWCNEFDKWLGEGAVKAFSIAESTPKGDRILSRFDGEGDVLVISYDQLRKYVDRISKMNGVDLVVCDEGHRLKNAEIKTTKAVDFLPTKRRIILSGTPIQNDLSEFHAMVGFVNPGILGNRDLFGRVFEEPIMLGRDPDCEEHVKDLGADRAHYLANMTQKFILRRTQTINEKYLPAKVDITVFCRLGAAQQESYEKISNLSKELSSTPLVLITALKKLCNHMDLLRDAVKDDGCSARGGSLPKSVVPKGYQGGSLDPKYGSKLAFVANMLDELRSNGERDKLVIVSNYTQTLDIIARLCDSRKVSFFQLDGKTPIKKRQELVDRFNVPMAQEIVFLLSSKAGGVGLNLIGANRLILFDPDWNPANDAQAMGRVWRDGQKKKVFIYRMLSTGTIEEKIYQRQVSKQGLSANVVDMKDDSKQHFSLDELKALFAFHPTTVCETHDLLDCQCHKPITASKDPTTKFSFKKHEAKPVQTGPRMDELKSWMHILNASKFALDKVMCAITSRLPQLVSFLFANERDAKKLEEYNTERAFTKDEGEITCASQGDVGGDEVDDLEVEVMDADDSDDDNDDSPSSSSDDEKLSCAKKKTKGKSVAVSKCTSKAKVGEKRQRHEIEQEEEEEPHKPVQKKTKPMIEKKKTTTKNDIDAKNEKMSKKGKHAAVPVVQEIVDVDEMSSLDGDDDDDDDDDEGEEESEFESSDDGESDDADENDDLDSDDEDEDSDEETMPPVSKRKNGGSVKPKLDHNHHASTESKHSGIDSMRAKINSVLFDED